MLENLDEQDQLNSENENCHQEDDPSLACAALTTTTDQGNKEGRSSSTHQGLVESSRGEGKAGAANDVGAKSNTSSDAQPDNSAPKSPSKKRRGSGVLLVSSRRCKRKTKQHGQGSMLQVTKTKQGSSKSSSSPSSASDSDSSSGYDSSD